MASLLERQLEASIKMNDRALAVVDRDPMTEWAVMREQAEVLVRSRLLPRAVDTAEKAIAIIQTGRELGIGPMQALRSIHVIDGKPTMSAELMAGLVLARLPGSVLRVVSTTNEECLVEAARPGQETTTFRFSMADARAAGLTGKDNWKKYPAPMLRARCLAGASRAIFPDATMGMLIPDELGAVTNEHGEILAHATVTSERQNHSPHDDGAAPAEGDCTLFDPLHEALQTVENSLAGCDTYDKALELRAILGTAAQQSRLTKDIQSVTAELSVAQRKELSRLWQKCNRQVAKLEKELATSAEDTAHTDPAEDFDR